MIALGTSFGFIGISETGRRDYSQSFLNRLSGGADFTWISRPRVPALWLITRRPNIHHVFVG
jgi:hypothetical protein